MQIEQIKINRLSRPRLEGQVVKKNQEFIEQHMTDFKQYLEVQTDSHVVAQAIREIEVQVRVQRPSNDFFKIKNRMWELFFKKFDDWLPF